MSQFGSWLSGWEYICAKHCTYIYSLLPSFIIFILNILMIKKVNSQRKFRIQHQTSQQGESAANPNNLTLTMFVVYFVFILTTLPGDSLLSIETVSKLLGIDSIFGDSSLYFIACKMYIINHSINFILYCVTGKIFRQTLVCLFTCHKRRISKRYSTQQCPTIKEQVQ